MPDQVSQNQQDISCAQLRSLIDRADAAYYRPGFKPIMSDANYDLLKQKLRELAPDDERNTRVGPPYSPSELRAKIPHLYPMGSLDNLDQGILGLEEWLEKIATTLGLPDAPDCMLSLKLDGNSLVANYDHGSLTQVLSRGNGEVGEDVTANAVHFRNLPTVLSRPITCSVRGEAMLYQADFEQLTQNLPLQERSNARNICAGIVGRSDGENADLVQFQAFNLFLPADEDQTRTEADKFALLTDLGFNTVPHQLFQGPDLQEAIQAYYDQILQQRTALPCGIDGLVLVLNDGKYQQRFIKKGDIKSLLRPKFARAIKFPEYSAETVLTGVQLSLGHDGSINPTATLEQVRIGPDGGGVRVSSALLNNFDEIRRLGLAIGDRVQVVLTGDIIPKLVRVVQQGENRREIVEPTKCPSCGAVTTRESRGKLGAKLFCCDPDCPAVMIRKIHHWIGTSKKGVGILDIGETMEQALWDDNAISDPSDLYRLTPERMEHVKLNGNIRIGRSRAEKVVNNIQSKRVLSLPVFLGALGIDLLGRRRVVLLAGAAAGQLDTLQDWLDDDKLAALDIPGLGDVTRAAIRSGIRRCRPLITRLLECGVQVEPLRSEPVATEGAGQPTGRFSGLSFVFTGTRECIDQVQELGAVVQDGVRKGTTFLVQKDASKVTNKSQKAEQLGTKVISLDYLKRVLQDESLSLI